MVVGLTVPHVAPVQPVPLSVQVTPPLAGSFWTMAVNDCVLFTTTLADVGDTETEIGGGGVTVTVAVLETVGSATEVAVTVTVAGTGTVPGAV